MPGTFSPPRWVSDPNMHQGTCVTHVPWCMPGPLTSGFRWSRWRGKGCRHSRCMRNPQFHASGKRPMNNFMMEKFKIINPQDPSQQWLPACVQKKRGHAQSDSTRDKERGLKNKLCSGRLGDGPAFPTCCWFLCWFSLWFGFLCLFRLFWIIGKTVPQNSFMGLTRLT